MTAVDVDSLPPTQYLILDVLAARYRTGEHVWTFPTMPAIVAAARRLERLGLVDVENTGKPATKRVRLTDAGKTAVLSEEYQPPKPFPDTVRVVVVVNQANASKPFGMATVHGMTCDNGEAQQWVRDLVAQHGDPLAATMTVGLVRPGEKAVV